MKPYTNPLITASTYEAYSESEIPNHVETMFPGNRGTGTAMDAQVNKRKKATKIAAALIFLLNLSGNILLVDITLQQFRAS